MIDEFYALYTSLSKRYNLRMHSTFSLYKDGLIEIHEYSGETRGRCICRVTGDRETCYLRALADLKHYKEQKSYF